MRNEEVRFRAKQFCEDHGINEYPVKIVNICNDLGLSVFEEYLNPDVSGLIVVDENKWDKYGTDRFIVVNRSDSPERRRFTVAHELAHFVLHREEETLYAHRDTVRKGVVLDKKEHEANYFATNVLMPEELVTDRVYDIKMWHGNVPTKIIIRDVAQNFLVSESAAEVRLKQLNLI